MPPDIDRRLWSSVRQQDRETDDHTRSRGDWSECATCEKLEGNCVELWDFVWKGAGIQAYQWEIQCRRQAYRNRWRQPYHTGWLHTVGKPAATKTWYPEEFHYLLAAPSVSLLSFFHPVHWPDESGAQGRRRQGWHAIWVGVGFSAGAKWKGKWTSLLAGWSDF